MPRPRQWLRADGAHSAVQISLHRALTAATATSAAIKRPEPPGICQPSGRQIRAADRSRTLTCSRHPLALLAAGIVRPPALHSCPGGAGRVPLSGRGRRVLRQWALVRADGPIADARPADRVGSKGTASESRDPGQIVHTPLTQRVEQVGSSPRRYHQQSTAIELLWVDSGTMFSARCHIGEENKLASSLAKKKNIIPSRSELF